MTKKLQNKKTQVKNKVQVSKAKKVKMQKAQKIEKAEKVENKPLSISKMTFAFITKHKVDTSNEKKKFFEMLKNDILKVYPQSHFNYNHYYWYIAKYKKQKQLNLSLECLKVIKK